MSKSLKTTTLTRKEAIGSITIRKRFQSVNIYIYRYSHLLSLETCFMFFKVIKNSKFFAWNHTYYKLGFSGLNSIIPDSIRMCLYSKDVFFYIFLSLLIKHWNRREKYILDSLLNNKREEN